MAQLPPKAPTTTMSQNLATFDHHRLILDQPAMLDDFLDWPNFSTTRRSSHRRSASDSVTFLEATPIDEFDGLDDDRLISMFSDDVAPHLTPVSWASDCDSLNEEKPPASSMNDLGEAESALVEDPPTMAQPTDGLASVLFDPKRVKRIIANRQSAQRSRVRKLQYISELERSVSTLQTEVSALSPRVAFLDQHRSILTMGNSNLKQRIAALAQDKIFKDARQEALKSEIERLRQVYQQQNLENMAHRTSDRAVGTNGELIT